LSQVELGDILHWRRQRVGERGARWRDDWRGLWRHQEEPARRRDVERPDARHGLDDALEVAVGVLASVDRDDERSPDRERGEDRLVATPEAVADDPVVRRDVATVSVDDRTAVRD